MAPIVLGLGQVSSGVPTEVSYNLDSVDDRGMAVVTGATAGSYANYWYGSGESMLFLGDYDSGGWDYTPLMRFPVNLPQGTKFVGGVLQAAIDSTIPAGLNYTAQVLGQVAPDSPRITTAGDATTWVGEASVVGSLPIVSENLSQYQEVEFPISGAHLNAILSQEGWTSGNFIQLGIRKSPPVRPGGNVGTLGLRSLPLQSLVLKVTYLA